MILCGPGLYNVRPIILRGTPVPQDQSRKICTVMKPAQPPPAPGQQASGQQAAVRQVPAQANAERPNEVYITLFRYQFLFRSVARVFISRI